MWGEALSMLDRADRLHRQFFTQVAPSWEPPVDIVEVDGALRVQMALPGVQADSVTIAADALGVTISAWRGFPGRDARAQIHRVEIPHGRFERRLAMNTSEMELTERTLADGVLTLAFRRKEST